MALRHLGAQTRSHGSWPTWLFIPTTLPGWPRAPAGDAPLHLTPNQIHPKSNFEVGTGSVWRSPVLRCRLLLPAGRASAQLLRATSRAAMREARFSQILCYTTPAPRAAPRRRTSLAACSSSPPSSSVASTASARSSGAGAGRTTTFGSGWYRQARLGSHGTARPRDCARPVQLRPGRCATCSGVPAGHAGVAH